MVAVVPVSVALATGALAVTCVPFSATVTVLPSLDTAALMAVVRADIPNPRLAGEVEGRQGALALQVVVMEEQDALGAMQGHGGGIHLDGEIPSVT